MGGSTTRSLTRPAFDRVGWRAVRRRFSWSLSLLLASVSPTSAQQLTTLVDWRGRLQLEETPAALVVAPHAIADARGMALADLREFRVSLYDFDGRLLRTVGRRGGGPGEFDSPPLSARRTPSGELLVAEFGGRLHVFPVSSDSARTTRVPIFPFYDVRPLDGSRLLLVGWGPLTQGERPGHAKLLHVWSVSEQRIVRSFFEVPLTGALLAPARSLGNVATDIRGDTVVATFSLSDTLYRFSLASGQPLGKTPIASTIFKPVTRAPGSFADAGGRAKWLESVSVIDAVFVLPDGRHLLQFSERYGADRRYRLLLLSRSGDVVLQLPDTPQLMALRDEGGTATLYFRGSDDDEPSTWRIATLKR